MSRILVPYCTVNNVHVQERSLRRRKIFGVQVRADQKGDNTSTVLIKPSPEAHASAKEVRDQGLFRTVVRVSLALFIQVLLYRYTKGTVQYDE